MVLPELFLSVMRRYRSPRGAIAEFQKNRNRRPTATLSNTLRRSVWVVNNDGHPRSPLSIERMSRIVERGISRVARVKPRFKTMPRKRNIPHESTPFFIDTNPSDELAGALCSSRRSCMNDSVVILDSPEVTTGSGDVSPKWPLKESRRQASVDTVDLCSEGEEERLASVKGNKWKKGAEVVPKKRRRLCVNPENTPQPDIIILDDEDESASTPVPSSNNSSIIIESTPLKLPHKFRGQDTTQSTSSISTSSETVALTNPAPSQSIGNDSKYVGQPLSVTVSKGEDVVLSSNAHPGPSGSEHLKSNPWKPELSSTVGSNVFNPYGNMQQTGLRPIIIDGCNVAIAHGGNGIFSVRGLCICVEYFLRRGHNQVVALVPLHQRSKVSPQDRDVLESLKNDSHLVFTPSRYIGKRLISSYDDRFIVQYAAAVGGVIVSRDNYRDLLSENPAWRDTINNRLLMPTWVGDFLMFPVDPLGKRGPSLDEFLRFPNI